jgi:hypothetical protein
MILSVSTLIIGKGAATPVRVVNRSMAARWLAEAGPEGKGGLARAPKNRGPGLSTRPRFTKERLDKPSAEKTQ